MLLLLVALLAILLYVYLRYVYSYWHRNGFPFIRPSIPVGNLALVAKRQASFGVCLYEIYKQSTKPFIGIYMLFKPVLLVRDASLSKRILTTDFNSFHDRGVYCNPKFDPMSENLFAMTGHRWKALRAKLTPTFSSGKLKNMLPTITLQGDRLQEYLVSSADKSEVVEMKDLLARYGLNVIGNVIFGVDADTISDPKHYFRTIERFVGDSSLSNVIKRTSVFLCPKVLEYFNINSIPAPVQNFMMEIVQQQIEHREKNQISRKDFIQFLIQLRNTGKINADDTVWDVETTADSLKNLSIEQCAAQVFLFYVAGFDTTASTTAYTIFELARNHKIMHRVQEEIDVTLKRHGGVLSYECIQEMEYMDLCIMETVRKYPALPILNRECTIDYPIPDSDLVLKKGTAVIISLLGMSRDPEYFPEPLLYRPERFSDAEPTYNADAYIPFGDGPRACIGVRLGKIAVKVALIKLLQQYNFDAVDKAEIEFNSSAVTLQAKGGIMLRVTNRESTQL